ncbi:MAG: serine hydrolase [Nostocaceae cyanobacterium]|nr:serine hydrolase [Nostocaceae cyanobacterium]
MSDSSYGLTGFSRRQPTNRRQVRRRVQKQGQNKVRIIREPKRGNSPASKLTKLPVRRPVTPTPSVPRRRSTAVVPARIQSTATVRGQIPPFKPGGTVKLKTVRVRKQGLPKKLRSSRKTRLKPMARIMLYVLRLLIVGVGIGAIMGTVLSILDPATRITAGASSDTQVGQTQAQPNINPGFNSSGLFLSQEIPSLKATVQNLAVSNANLTPGVLLVDLDTGAYVDMNAGAAFPAASTIKIPILVAFFQDVDRGKIRLDEMLTMEKEMVASGSGDMQYKPVGSKYTALEVATKMMVISDNTATNMLIARMGGIEVLNQRFRSWGLTTTAIRNPLPDLQGTNTTSPKELGNLIAMVSKGKLVSMRSRDRIIDIMRRNTRNHLLPAGLGPGATIANKTGDIGTMLADAGLVDLPTGKRYIAAVMVQRPHNDPSAEQLIKSVSSVAYQQFSQAGFQPHHPSGSVSGGINPGMVNIPNRMGSTIPTTGYQPPVMNPAVPGMGSNVPPTGYQPPVMNQQYYYPYRR